MSIGFLFVATMFQISLSIKMITDPYIDCEKVKIHKLYVYTLAAIASILFSFFYLGANIFMYKEEDELKV